MAECVYRRQGQSFKSFLCITANAGDKVTIVASDSRGLDSIENPFTMGSAGKVTLVVKKKGTYKVSGEESNITQTVNITERRVDNNVDVSFINTVTVNANSSATITLSNYDGVTRNYSATASSNGIATVTVKRKGDYSVSTSTTSSNTTLSTSPSSSTKLTCSTNGAKQTINHVRVSNLSSITATLTSATAGNVKCTIAAHNGGLFSGGSCRYKIDSAPSSMSDGTSLFTSGYSGTTGSLTLNRTWYFKAWPYITVNSVNYYGNPSQTSKYVQKTTIDNRVNGNSGSITIPDACTKLVAYLVGGGGGGGNCTYAGSGGRAGGGGGGGHTKYLSSYAVTAGKTLSWTIGGGGGSTSSGGTTYLYYDGKQIAIAGGGSGGSGGTRCDGGAGGSGGGAGGWRLDTSQSSTWNWYSGRAGGSGGASGGSNLYQSGKYGGSGGSGDNGVSGKDSSELVFTYNNVAYCGGGGGGAIQWDDMSVGSGGAGGGGSGGKYVMGTSGTNGTGGGGGGTGGVVANGGSGGSGCVIFSLS